MDLQMAVEKQLEPQHIKRLLEGVAIATSGLRPFCREPAVVIVCSVERRAAVFRAWALVNTGPGTEVGQVLFGPHFECGA